MSKFYLDYLKRNVISKSPFDCRASEAEGANINVNFVGIRFLVGIDAVYPKNNANATHGKQILNSKESHLSFHDKTVPL